jgi:outer membrane lipoprotein carrier protein
VSAFAIAEQDFRARHKYVPGGCGRAIPGAPARENPVLQSPLLSLLPASVLALLMTAAAAHADPATTAAAVPAAPVAPAAGQNATLLTDYLDHLKTLRATFLQTLADANGREIDRARGTLIVLRPGKFSWAIQPQPAAAASGGAGAAAAGGADATAAGSGAASSGAAAVGASAGQLMVCDGVNLWFYDRDLQQVTVKPVDAALSATPAMLLSGAVDVRKSFTITDAGQRMGLDWVLVEPNGTDADFRSALFGFEHGDLKRMILEDKLDQTATIIFEKIERNGRVSPREVSFTPPAGADVIGKPRR